MKIKVIFFIYFTERSLSMDINGHVNLKKMAEKENKLDVSMYEQGSSK